MIFLGFASSIFGTSKRQERASRRTKRSVIERVADALFYRPVGPAGVLGRLGMLVVVALVSYFAGAGLGTMIMKAPVAVALIIGAVLVGWANSDPNID